METNKILKFSLATGILAVLFIPFVVSYAQLFPFITGKAFVFRILVEILFGVWLIAMLRDPALRPRFSWLMGAILFFVGAMTLSAIFGTDFYRSFWSNYERMDGLVTLLHLLAYFLVVGSTLNTRANWYLFFNTSVVASFVMSFYAFLQLSGKIVINQGGVRVDGTLGNATYLAIYMLFNFFIALFLLMRARQDGESRPNYYLYSWYAVAMVCHVIVIYYTATRGVILGLIGGLILTTIFISLFEKNRPALRKIAIGGLILLALTVGGFFAIKNTEFVKSSPTLSRFSSLSLEEINNQGRRYTWPMAVSGFQEKPILGWGQENFGEVFAKHYDPRMYNQEPWFDRAHNIVLDVAVAGGVVGLAGYLSIFAALLVLLYRNQTFTITDKSIILGLTSAYFFQNLFVFDNLISHIYFFSLLAFLHSENVRGKTEPKWLQIFGNNTYVAQKVMPAVLIVLTIALVYSLNAKPIFANRSIIRALTIQNTTPEQSLDHFRKALSYDTFANVEAVEQMFNQFSRFATAGVSAETQKAYASTVIEAMEGEISAHPNNVRLTLFAGSFLNRLGDHDNARLYLERAREMSPKKQNILFELGFAHLSKAEYDKAFEYFKTAYDSAPDFTESKVLLIIGSLYNSNDSLADELISTLDENVFLNDERIVAAFAGTGNIGEAVKIMERRVELNPQNVDLRFRLSAGYLMMEQRSKSIETLRGIVNEFPAGKERAEYYIKEIQAGRNP